MIVIKRNGESAEWDRTKVMRAIEGAWRSVHDEADIKAIHSIALAVEEWLEYTVPGVDEVQDRVIATLMERGHFDVAEHFGMYRATKNRLRHAMDIDARVAELSADDVANENANKDPRVFHTHRDLLAGQVSKAKALAMLPKDVAEAHVNGDIHYHDLDYSLVPMTNCSLPDFKGMMENGFTLGAARIEQPKSIATAATVLSQLIAGVSSAQYGGVTVEHIDSLLAPYAEMTYHKHMEDASLYGVGAGREDRERYAHAKTVKAIYDAMQTLEYQLNSIHTSNGQTPFCSLGFGLNTSMWGKEIQQAILQVRLDGLGKDKRTAIFPKLIYAIREGVNDKPGSPGWEVTELAAKCQSIRMYPDILFYENVVKATGDFKFPMGCRSFLSTYREDDGEVTTIKDVTGRVVAESRIGKPVTAGRMNLGVVTLNLPRIAMETDGNRKHFLRVLADRLELCHKALRHREAFVRTAKPANAPLLYMEGGFGKRLDPWEEVGTLFDDGRATLSLGYIGLHETVSVFYGEGWETNGAGMDFAQTVMEFMTQRIASWNEKDRTGTNGTRGAKIGLYGTPSESLTDRFARLDREKFGENRITVKPEGSYYTNSFHLDPRKDWNIVDKFQHEARFTYQSNSGFIVYAEYPKMIGNEDTLLSAWECARLAGVPYLGSNVPIDYCYSCGFTGDFEPTADGFRCPDCENVDPDFMDVVKRTCGYLGNPATRPWVAGRAAEHRSRVKHDMV